jgi:nitroreductase
MEHMFLTAVSHGLSACFIGFLDVNKANEILDLPDNITCLFLLPVGYADEIPKEKDTKSIDEISFNNIWDLV